MHLRDHYTGFRFAALAVLGLLALHWYTIATAATLTDEGLRRIEVERFGVVANAPLAWRLIRWGQDNQAFVLSLPQEAGSPAGRVTCELGLAPRSLDEYRKQNAVLDEAEQQSENPRRKLTRNECTDIDPRQFGQPLAALAGRRLLSTWEHALVKGVRCYEECVRLICHDTLYTFTLQTDEAHYDAYRLDFEQLIKSAELSRPETGLKPLAGNYWLQQQYLFAMRLPTDWQTAIALSDKALFCAKGPVHDVFADNLVVHASKLSPLDLTALQKSRPDSVTKADANAKVSSCQVVQQATGNALETVFVSRRGNLPVTVIERHFCGGKRNYEVIVTVASSDYENLAAEIRKSLDSFREVVEKEPAAAI